MADAFDSLRRPVDPVDPDPGFAARLREQLAAALDLPRGVVPMTSTTVPTASTDLVAQQRSVSAYLAVDDARRALDFYTEVFAARRVGEPIVMPDGRVGHAELDLGDSRLMLSDAHPELGLLSPRTRGGVSTTLVVLVDDVDATINRAVAAGAELERPARDEPYGRTGVVRDVFGHRWMVQQRSEPAAPPPDPARPRQGDVEYFTMRVPDEVKAAAFYGALLGWETAPGNVPRGRQITNVRPLGGLWGGADQPNVQLMYRVADIAAAVSRVRELGGTAEEPTRMPYGLSADCVDDQGQPFWLLQAD